MVRNSELSQLQREQAKAIEDALRWLATRKHANPLGLLVHAIEDPKGDSAEHLAPLVAPTASLRDGTAETRALAVWGLIVDLIQKVGSADDSRRRNALIAAFRLPRRAEIAEPWKSSLGDRFKQLMDLPGVFGNPKPTTTTPMHKAWGRAVGEKLAPMLRERLGELEAQGDAWRLYLEIARQAEAESGTGSESTSSDDPTAGYRLPSKGAQPVFLNLFVTTVFMRRRSVYRRITERLVTAQANGVDAYIATALAGKTGNPPDVRGLWGCHAEHLLASRVGEPALARLRFPRVLQRGEMHYFSSEAIDENVTAQRRWVNVEVDHYGIAPGQLLHGCVPISGLTIRIRFDGDYLPEACWWYAEMTERERYEQPSKGDARLLTVVDGAAEHTFTQKCQPRDNYGVSILWPD